MLSPSPPSLAHRICLILFIVLRPPSVSLLLPPPLSSLFSLLFAASPLLSSLPTVFPSPLFLDLPPSSYIFFSVLPSLTHLSAVRLYFRVLSLRSRAYFRPTFNGL